MITVPVDFASVALTGVFVPEHIRAFLSMGVLCVLLLHSEGRIRARLHLSTLDDLPWLLGRAFVAAALVATVTALRHPNANLAELLRWATVAVCLLVAGRMTTTAVLRAARRRRIISRPTLVVGGGQLGVELVKILDRYPQYGLRVAGIVDDREIDEIDGGDEPVHGMVRLGRLGELDEAVRRSRANVLLIADPARPDGTLLDVVRGGAAARCDLMVVPRLHEFHTQVGQVDHIGAIPIMRIKSPTLLGPSRLAKRLFDMLAAAVGIIVLSPVLLAAAVAVRVDGGRQTRDVLFRQARMTRDGRIFQVLKFRSMRPLSEAELAGWGTSSSESRISRVGALLRKTSIDELPQLWNILRGDMTLVGPRPELPVWVEQFSAQHQRYAERHRVTCGLTGLAQVSGLRGDTSISDRARYDNFYIENWSPWMDVKVLVRTVGEVFRAKGR
jgi:exopolysaccharide biosynthesis polyprenyl glycosylphosphotransferase